MLHKIFPDKEKARSIFRMALEREKSVSDLNLVMFATIATENYYEIIKELATTILLLNGIKATGENAHKEILDCLEKYANFNGEEILMVQDLRIKRNKSTYEGKQISPSYLENNKNAIVYICSHFSQEIKDKIKSYSDKIRIKKVVKAGDYAPFTYRFCFDLAMM